MDSADGGAEALGGAAVAGLAVATVAVVAVAGIMSGLTLGLLSLDRLDLEVMLRTGNKQQERFARRLMPMVNNPHWVLATLVICNTAASMALPLCLDRLVNVVVALLLSTTAIVLFGEILPQAVCSRYGLQVGGHAAPVVRLLMLATAPISWPIGKALDLLLGREAFVFGKRQIRAFVDLHRESAGMGGPLNEEEFHVIQGVLDLGKKKGAKAMTPLDKVVMLGTNDTVDRPTLRRILDSGHSRLPVHRGSNRQDIIGLVLVKELLAVVAFAQPGAAPVRVADLPMRDLPALPVDTPMTDLLNLFQTGHSHMALLVAPCGSHHHHHHHRRGHHHHRSSSRRSDDGNSSDGGAGSMCSSSSSSSSLWRDSASSSSVCSSSSVGGSDAGSPRSRSSAKRVASLLQCLSSNSRRRRQPHKRSKSKHQAAGSIGEIAAAAAAVDLAHQDQQHKQQQHEAAAAASGHVVIQLAPDAAAAAAGTTGGQHGQQLQPLAAACWSLPATTSPQPPGADRHSQDVAVAAATAAAAAVAPAAALSRAAAAASSSSLPVLGPVGIITLEDVLEELMQEEIVDETDAYVDNEKTRQVDARLLAMSLPPGLRRLLLASQQMQQQQQQQGAAAISGAAAVAGAAASAAADAPASLAPGSPPQQRQADQQQR